MFPRQADQANSLPGTHPRNNSGCIMALWAPHGFARQNLAAPQDLKL